MKYFEAFHGRRSVFCAVIGLFFVLFCSAVQATSVTVAWDANNEPDVAGYKLHYGTAQESYANTVDVGANTEFAANNLEPGKTYYFAVTAYNDLGLESDFSDEISKAVATFQITTAPSSRVAATGSRVTLSVDTTNAGALSYQWLKDGAMIPNAVEQVYTINKIDAASVGAYSVRISDGTSMVTTPAANIGTVHLQLPRSVVIHGVQGSSYQIFYKDDLTSSEWTPAAEIDLDSESYEFEDVSAINAAQRFYQVTPKQ